MKLTKRRQSTNIQDLREGSISLDKRIGKSLTYQNYEKRPRSKAPTNKTGNTNHGSSYDSMPRRSEKTKRNNRQR